ncbi:MAG: rhodanese-like domain-containing protein [Candidatus Poribacteria bacterium]|nr:rhodanese-like domain-containing protein [Candidatus Poribacteria bacterium]
MAGYKGYENPQLVISAEELKGTLDDGKFCIVDTRPAYEYIRGHIPGALHLDLFGLSLIDTRKETFDAFMWMMAYLFQQRGLDPTKPIVWYEDISGTRASRGLWFCEYLGHSDTRLLDGGFRAWLAAEGPISTEGAEPPEVLPFEINAQRDTHMDADVIHVLLNREDFVPLDTRTDDEHYGRVARAERAGAIPGSIHIEWLNNLDEAGAFKTADKLREMYMAVGITPEKQVMCY